MLTVKHWEKIGLAVSTLKRSQTVSVTLRSKRCVTVGVWLSVHAPRARRRLNQPPDRTRPRGLLPLPLSLYLSLLSPLRSGLPVILASRSSKHERGEERHQLLIQCDSLIRGHPRYITKLVECPVVDKTPARVSVLYAGQFTPRTSAPHAVFTARTHQREVRVELFGLDSVSKWVS